MKAGLHIAVQLFLFNRGSDLRCNLYMTEIKKWIIPGNPYFCTHVIHTFIKIIKTMKKIYSLTLIFSAAVLPAFGQARFSGAAHPVSAPATTSPKAPSSVLAGADTLEPPSFGMPFQCDTAPKYYNWQAPASGFVFGNNSYGELECAQKYYATGTVEEVLVWIAYKKGTTGLTTAKIYTINPATKGPSTTVLGTSAPVTTGSISTTAFTSYTFAATVAVTNEFAAAVVFPTTTGDTIAVVSTAIGCATPDSLSWGNFPSFGGWLCTPALISGNPNCDLYIFPVGTLSPTLGINEYSAHGLSLLGAYPNPAKDATNITYRLDEASEVSVNVFDLSGRVIYNSTEQVNAGSHSITISLEDVAAGNYYYTVKSSDSQLTSKFSVVR